MKAIIFFSLCVLLTVGCSESRKTYPLNVKVKDLSAYERAIRSYTSTIEELEPVDHQFATPVFEVNDQNHVFLSNKIVRATRFLTDKASFTCVVIDNNNNQTYDDADEIHFTGYDQDSVLFQMSPFRIVNKNPVYLAYEETIFRIDVANDLSNVSIEEKRDFQYSDLNFAAKIPDITVEDMQSGETRKLADYHILGEEILVIRTAPYCKPCLRSFLKFIAIFDELPKEAQNTKIVFFYPETTHPSNIVKYTSEIKSKHNVSFVRGDLARLDNTYGFVSLPDGVLFDNEGTFKSNHFFLSDL